MLLHDVAAGGDVGDLSAFDSLPRAAAIEPASRGSPPARSSGLGRNWGSESAPFKSLIGGDSGLANMPNSNGAPLRSLVAHRDGHLRLPEDVS
jgi:hypothetical protein